MKIDRLLLAEFRGFASKDLEFSDLTVLVGENGAGKTSVLEGLAVALGGYLSVLPSVHGARHIRPDDVRYVCYEHAGQLDFQRQWPAVVVATGTIGNQPVRWERALRTPGGRTDRANLGLMKVIGEHLAGAVQDGQAIDLPVVAYYGTQRLWLQKKTTDAKRGVGSRYDGYIDALDPASNHRVLSEWMYQQTLIELQTQEQVSQLRAVEQAVCRCISGATRFVFDVKSGELEIRLATGENIPFHALSDGYRNMVALAADIAWRAAVLNPHHGADAALRSSGVVLIDEVDLHLHPRWQRRVMGDLRAAFPLLQFIVTSHSPQVISSVRRDQVRLLSATHAVAPHVEGRDSNSLLEDVFGVPARPAEVQARIDEMSRLIEVEEFAAAGVALAALQQILGPDDPAIIRAAWQLDLEARTVSEVP